MLLRKITKDYTTNRAPGDFAREKPIEKAVAEKIRQLNGFDSYELVPDKRFSEFDFVIRKGNEEITYELKRTEARTGNIFVEIESARTGKPSALSVTKADRWIEYIEPLNLLASTTPEEMRGLLARHPEFTKITFAGQGAIGFLVPISVFMSELKPRTIKVPVNFGRN